MAYPDDEEITDDEWDISEDQWVILENRWRKLTLQRFSVKRGYRFEDSCCRYTERFGQAPSLEIMRIIAERELNANS